MCIVVIVVVVIRVVVVSSSTGGDVTMLLEPDWLTADAEVNAVVSTPGDMTVAVVSVWPRPGTAWVGLVVVPARATGSEEHKCPIT